MCNPQLEILNDTELDELQFSPEYGQYIMENCNGERVICNGDMLLDLQEEGYLFPEFLASLGFAME